MSIWKWASLIEAPPAESQVTLGEGDTPLIRSRSIGPKAGLANLFFKLELCNPTGSFKDRFAAAAISHMVAAGQRRCVATSSGNTGSSLAAYCAAAEIECEIAVVEPAPIGKLKQMMAYGANIYRVREFGINADITQRVFDCLERISSRPDAAMQVSSFVFSAAGMNGVQTISFELAEQSSEPIDFVFCQAGGGGMTRAVAMGFEQLVRDSRLACSPKVECVQPVGNNTIAGPLRDGLPRGQNVVSKTEVSGLQVASVVDGDEVITACRRCGGTGHLVTDEQVWEAQARLAREEGIFSEPAGATGLAGVLQAVDEGRVQPNDRVVCLITGSAFKDPSSIDRLLSNADCPLIELAELENR